MRRWIRQWWRRLRNRCTICGMKRSPVKEGDPYTYGPFCRKCNKGIFWGQMYGAGPVTMKRILDARRETESDH